MTNGHFILVFLIIITINSVDILLICISFFSGSFQFYRPRISFFLFFLSGQSIYFFTWLSSDKYWKISTKYVSTRFWNVFSVKNFSWWTFFFVWEEKTKFANRFSFLLYSIYIRTTDLNEKNRNRNRKCLAWIHWRKCQQQKQDNKKTISKVINNFSDRSVYFFCPKWIRNKPKSIQETTEQQ